MKKCIYFIILIFIVCSSCKEMDLEYVKSKQWQYEEGYKISPGDFVDFTYEGTPFSIKNKTIYFKNNPVAVVVKVNKYSNEMVVASVDGKEIGVYINTDEFAP